MDPGLFGRKINEIAKINQDKNISSGIGYKESIETHFNQIENQTYDVYLNDESYFGGVLAARDKFLADAAVMPQDQTINGLIVTTKSPKGSREPLSFSNPRIVSPVATPGPNGQIGQSSTDSEFHILDLVYPGGKTQGPVVIGGTSYLTATENTVVDSSTDVGTTPPVEEGSANAEALKNDKKSSTYFGQQNQGSNDNLQAQQDQKTIPKSPVGASTNTGTVKPTVVTSWMFVPLAFDHIKAILGIK